MAFRLDVHFLRAISVLAVILFHANIPFFKNGYLGVDIFFVISGYLLTSIYYFNINFSFISFFTKRAFRIVPSILALVFLLSILFFFFLYPSDYYDFAKSAFSCLIFISNFYYFFTENYFDNYNKSSLLHTWSVSLEMQLYLIFALTIYYFKKRSIYIFTILGFLSFIFFLLDNNPRSYYLLTSHSWPFFFGCLIYFARLDFKKYAKKIFWLSFLVLTIFIVFPIDLITSYKKLNSLFVVILVSAIIIVYKQIRSDYYVNLLLKINIFKYLGNISYSLYLFHYPIFFFNSYLSLSKDSVFVKILLIFLIFLISHLNHILIEKKF